MAYIELTYDSTAISRAAQVSIELPNDANEWERNENLNYSRPMKVLYLLHGYQNDCTEWQTHAPVRELALKYNIAMVMPYGANSFYLDAKGRGNAYCRYIGEELPAYLHDTLGLPCTRRDCYIGGISMGGFGAIHTALSYPERYEKVFAMAPALIVHNIENQPKGFVDFLGDYDFYTSIFGDLSTLATSKNNPEYLLKTLRAQARRIPPLFQVCGTEDFLLEGNRQFQQVLKQQQAQTVYHEGPGSHQWHLWNRYLEEAIQFLLLENNGQE
jgi:S-formylglutathione hydrolase FrmB